jgi:predicted nuclease of predicted toxin-antitoxin system
MKVLLDECLPRKLKNSLRGHECYTVPAIGLAGKKNGELLSVAESLDFEVFLTMDKGIAYEQSLAGRRVAVIIVRAKSNRLADLLPHVSECLAVIGWIQPGQVVRIGLN